MIKRIKNENNFDWIIFICVLLLVIFGIIMVYSASNYVAINRTGNKYYYMNKQIIGAVIGLVCLIVCYFVPVKKLQKFGLLFLLLSVLLLAIVFIPGIGKTSYGANRWINLGAFTIQPSEIAKFFFILYASCSLVKLKNTIKSFKSMLPVLLSGCSVCLLIILEPNMSITVCVGLCMLVMLFIGGSSIKNMLLIAIPVLLLIPLLIIIEPYRLQRLTAYLDPWSSPLEEGFQLLQSYYSLGSGGWFGVGLFNSRQKHLFLPFSESDFIFSIIGEELGYIGCCLVILVFIIITIRGFKIAVNADTRFKCYLASGITALISIQTFLNIAVVTGTIPPTGLPLPFISAGSSALIMFLMGVGILLACNKKDKVNYNLSS